MGRTPFCRTSNELEHHFSNIKRTQTCSSIDDRTRTPFSERTCLLLIKESFKREDPGDYFSDEEIETKAKSQIKEVNQMFQRLEQLTRFDTSSLVVEN